MGILDAPGYSRSQADARFHRGANYMILPYGWDAGWKAALAVQATTPVNVAMFSDSVGAGRGSTDWLNNGWFGKVRAGLLARSGVIRGGDYYSAAVDGTSQSAYAGTSPYTLQLTGGNFWEAGYGRGYAANSAQATASTFTTPYPCTALDIVYLDWTGSFTYSVDGAADVTVTNTGNNTGAGSLVKKVSITGLTSGTHTVSVGHGSNGNALVLLGIACYPSAVGLRFARHAFPGIRGVDLTTGAGPTTGAGVAGSVSAPTDKIKQFQGPTPAGAATGFGFPAQPHLAFLGYGLNDCTNGASLWMFKNMLRRSVSAIRRGQPNASIAVVAYNYPDVTSGDNNVGGDGRNYHRYKIALSETARAYGCAFIDIDSKWGNYALANGFQPSGDLHPTDAGHADIANTILGVI